MDASFSHAVIDVPRRSDPSKHIIIRWADDERAAKTGLVWTCGWCALNRHTHHIIAYLVSKYHKIIIARSILFRGPRYMAQHYMWLSWSVRLRACLAADINFIELLSLRSAINIAVIMGYNAAALVTEWTDIKLDEFHSFREWMSERMVQTGWTNERGDDLVVGVLKQLPNGKKYWHIHTHYDSLYARSINRDERTTISAKASNGFYIKLSYTDLL